MQAAASKFTACSQHHAQPGAASTCLVARASRSFLARCVASSQAMKARVEYTAKHLSAALAHVLALGVQQGHVQPPARQNPAAQKDTLEIVTELGDPVSYRM